MKYIKFLPIAALVMCALSGCSKDDDESPVGLYQQYEVFIDNGVKGAFANFRLGDANGERMRLGKGSSVLCNSLTMFYSQVGEDFNYSVVLDPYHKKAKFQLIRPSGKTFKNEVDISDLPNITFSSTDEELKEGKVVLNLDGAERKDVTAYVYVSSLSGSEESVSKSKVILPISSDGVLDTGALGNERYEIYVDYEENHPTTENDRDAKGNIRVIKRVRRMIDFRDSSTGQETQE